jgi:hypothetical protein
METFGGRGDIAATHSRSQHQMGMSDQRHAPSRALAPGKGPRYSLYRGLGGPQSRSGHKD